MELVGALIAPLLAGMAAAGPAVELELLYRNDQLLPGALVPIAGIQERAPEPCGDAVGFRASSPGHGIWAYRVTPSGVEVVADGTVQIPGSSETFGGVVDLRCRGAGRFSFVGRGAAPGGSVYGWSPDGSIELFQSEGVVVEGVAFGAMVGQRANHQGVAILAYLAPFYSGEGLMYRPLTGAARFVTDDTLILPGQTEPPSSLSQPRAVDDGMVFKAITGFDGALYHWSPSKGITPLIDSTVPIPGAGGTFHGVGFVAVMARGIAFTTNTSIGRGIYLVDLEGNVEPFVVPGQQTSEGRTLLFADEASGAGELLSFTGIVDEPVPTPAVYVRTPEGTIHRLIGIGDPYDGTVVTDVGAAADEHSVAVLIGVARATVPTQYILRARFAGAAAIPTVGPVALIALFALLIGGGMWQLARWRSHRT